MKSQDRQDIFMAFNKPLGPFLAPTDDVNTVIGPLDDNATGLMILTNKKKISGLESEYVVSVDKPISKSFIATLRTKLEPISIKKMTDRKFKIILFREDLRNASEAIGYRITSLKRIRLGPVKLRELGEGNERQLTKKERQELMNLL